MPSSPPSTAQNAHLAHLGCSIPFFLFGEVGEGFTILVGPLPVSPPCAHHVTLGGETSHGQGNLAVETFPLEEISVS